MKNLLFLLLFVFCKNNSFAQTHYSGQSIEDILKLPENKINIGIASLVLAKEFYPKLDVQFFLNTFDYLAERYKYYFGKYTNPNDRIAALNTYLYKPGFWNDSITFSYDNNDLQVTKLKNMFINGYIASKEGSCITMPMLYLILGERLGFPIYPVRSAKHFFVRYILQKPIKHFLENIEATNGGGYISNSQYKEDVLIPDKAIKNGVYLRTLTKKEYIASLLLVNADEYLKDKNVVKAKKYFLLAIKYDSTFSPAYWNYGLIALSEAKELEDKIRNEIQNLVSQNEFLNNLDKRKSKNEVAPPSNNFSSQINLQQNIIQSAPNPSSFWIFTNNSNSQIDNFKINIGKENNHISNNTNNEAETQIELMEIENKYKPLILEKIKTYKEYTQKAEQLGIVHEFPIRFFEKQMESIKKFKQQGGY